ncbi:MAG: hypothetical protein M3Q06_08795 [Bacteroidota bacterium]|nr:hypothetical protein [Bacteroidota bacterium]
MNNDLTILITKYLNGEASDSEQENLDAWYLSFDSLPGLTDQLNPEELVKAMTESYAALSGKLDCH